MYHSDYESDYESRIPVIWKPSYSDSEEKDFKFRRVQPIIPEPTAKPERKPSPPCPHSWETHDQVDRLEQELKTRKYISVKTMKVEQLSQKLEKLTRETSSQRREERRENKVLPTTDLSKGKKQNNILMKDKEPSKPIESRSQLSNQAWEQVTDKVRQWAASHTISSEWKPNQEDENDASKVNRSFKGK